MLMLESFSDNDVINSRLLKSGSQSTLMFINDAISSGCSSRRERKFFILSSPEKRLKSTSSIDASLLPALVRPLSMPYWIM